jgi:hypothetical protein
MMATLAAALAACSSSTGPKPLDYGSCNAGYQAMIWGVYGAPADSVQVSTKTVAWDYHFTGGNGRVTFDGVPPTCSLGYAGYFPPG